MIAIALPRIFLNLGIGPEIPLFGSVTWAALGHATLDGLRLAALLVAVIALTTLFDVRKLLARAPRWLQPLALTAGSALTFIPVLSENIARIRRAAKMRRSRIGSIVTPILEGAVERSLALAASMELRGFGTPLITAQDSRARLHKVSLRIGSKNLLDEIDFEYRDGEVVLIAGATGSGKTLFLQTLCGLAPAFTGGSLSGERRGSSVALVNQKPELSFACEIVSDEIAFAPQLLGLTAIETKKRVEELASTFDLNDLLGRNVNDLSAGQQQRVAIAAALAGGATTLLLDEPSSALDELGLGALRQQLQQLSESGVSIIIAEHHVERFIDLADRVLFFQQQRLHTLKPLDAQMLASRRLTAIEGSVAPRLVLLGPNGSGKSTALQQLWEQNPDAAFVPQQASDLLLATRVSDELFTHLAKQLFEKFAPEVDQQMHPHDLSAGQQLALALAVQLGTSSKMILLDEPTRGLDFETKSELIRVLEELSAAGHRMVIATNDAQFAQAVATEVKTLSGAHDE